MAKLAIKGHATRGKEVIEILEMLGVKNVDNYKGNDASWYYIIRNNEIDWCHECTPERKFICFTLEGFLERFPYKVGDKVKHSKINDIVGRITDARWDNKECQVSYYVEWDDDKKELRM